MDPTYCYFIMCHLTCSFSFGHQEGPAVLQMHQVSQQKWIWHSGPTMAWFQLCQMNNGAAKRKQSGGMGAMWSCSTRKACWDSRWGPYRQEQEMRVGEKPIIHIFTTVNSLQFLKKQEIISALVLWFRFHLDWQLHSYVLIPPAVGSERELEE